jgi:hypothetical protein
MVIHGNWARHLLALAVCFVLALAGAAGCSHGDPIVGCWQWSGGVIEAFPDGSLQHSTDTGRWTDQGGSNYVFTWASGNIDGITLENGVIVEVHLLQPPGSNAPPWTATPTSCDGQGSPGPGNSNSGGCSSDSDCSGSCGGDCYQCLGGSCNCGYDGADGCVF